MGFTSWNDGLRAEVNFLGKAGVIVPPGLHRIVLVDAYCPGLIINSTPCCSEQSMVLDKFMIIWFVEICRIEILLTGRVF